METFESTHASQPTPLPAGDISDFAAIDIAPFTVKHPVTKEPMMFGGKPATITMYGPGSERSAQWDARRNKRMLALAKANSGEFELTPEEQEWQRVEKLVWMTASIDNLPCRAAGEATGEEFFRAVYKDRAIGYVAQQAETHCSGWQGFMPGSAKN